MNDDFLNRFQKSPRPEFESALYKRINKPIDIQNHTICLLRQPGIFLWNCDRSACINRDVFVPNARAAVQSVIRRSRVSSFDEVTESPITCDPMTAFTPWMNLETMSLEEVQAPPLPDCG